MSGERESICILDLGSRDFFQKLRDLALEYSIDELGSWRRLYLELSDAANMIDAALARSENENLCDTCSFRQEPIDETGRFYCDAGDCLIRHRVTCRMYDKDV